MGLLYIRPADNIKTGDKERNRENENKDDTPQGRDLGSKDTQFSSEPINLMRLVVPPDKKEKERGRSSSPSGYVQSRCLLCSFSARIEVVVR